MRKILSLLMLLAVSNTAIHSSTGSEQWNDSVTSVIRGVIERGSDESHDYWTVSAMMPCTVLSSHHKDARFEKIEKLAGSDGTFELELHNTSATLIDLGFISKKSGAFNIPICIIPGDTIEMTIKGRAAEIFRNGMKECNKFDKLYKIRFADFLNTKDADESPESFLAKMDTLMQQYMSCSEYDNLTPTEREHWNARLSIRVAELCMLHDSQHGVHVSSDSSAARIFLKKSGLFDCKTLFRDSEAPYLMNEIYNSLVQVTNAAPSDSTCFVLDKKIKECFSVSASDVSVVGQWLLIYNLSSLCSSNESTKIEYMEETERLVRCEELKDLWLEMCDAILENKNDMYSPFAIDDATINKIIKKNRSRYIELIFVTPDAHGNKLLFFSDNIRRDFRKSKDISIVYVGIANNDEEVGILESLREKQYIEEHFYYINQDEYISLLNNLRIPSPADVLTLNKHGRVLKAPLNFMSNEFFFRKELRYLLRRDR